MAGVACIEVAVWCARATHARTDPHSPPIFSTATVGRHIYMPPQRRADCAGTPPPHTHTHTHRHTNAQAHTHTHTHTRTHAHSHTRSHTRTHTRARAHTHTQKNKNKHTHTHTNTHTHAHTCTRARTHTQSALFGTTSGGGWGVTAMRGLGDVITVLGDCCIPAMMMVLGSTLAFGGCGSNLNCGLGNLSCEEDLGWGPSR